MKKDAISKLMDKEFKIKRKIQKVESGPKGLALSGLAVFFMSAAMILGTLSTTGLVRLILTFVLWAGVGAGMGIEIASLIFATKLYKNMEKMRFNHELGKIRKQIDELQKANNVVKESDLLVDINKYPPYSKLESNTKAATKAQNEKLVARKAEMLKEEAKASQTADEDLPGLCVADGAGDSNPGLWIM